jgi:hypothetical protein
MFPGNYSKEQVKMALTKNEYSTPRLEYDEERRVLAVVPGTTGNHGVGREGPGIRDRGYASTNG